MLYNVFSSCCYYVIVNL